MRADEPDEGAGLALIRRNADAHTGKGRLGPNAAFL